MINNFYRCLILCVINYFHLLNQMENISIYKYIINSDEVKIVTNKVL